MSTYEQMTRARDILVELQQVMILKGAKDFGKRQRRRGIWIQVGCMATQLGLMVYGVATQDWLFALMTLGLAGVAFYFLDRGERHYIEGCKRIDEKIDQLLRKIKWEMTQL
jgi:hypothetical protein